MKHNRVRKPSWHEVKPPPIIYKDVLVEKLKGTQGSEQTTSNLINLTSPRYHRHTEGGKTFTPRHAKRGTVYQSFKQALWNEFFT